MAQYTGLDLPTAVVRRLRCSSTIGSCRKLESRDLAATPGPLSGRQAGTDFARTTRIFPT